MPHMTEFSPDITSAIELGVALIHKAIIEYDETGKLPDNEIKIDEYLRCRRVLLLALGRHL
jgi:hypothetical protein